MEEKNKSEDVGDYEIFDLDFTSATLSTVMEPTQLGPWVKPEKINLKHRIGRGQFGDVWIATLHTSDEEFEEFHEVAAKILSFVKDEQVTALLPKFYHIFQRCQNLKRVSWPRGISRKNDKVCIITKFYEGSIGDKMARLKENRLSLSDVQRYGLELAISVLELHSVGIMALNLKPCNCLLDNQDKVVLGEFGIPLLLLGGAFSDNEEAIWLGTPNYMAPEQWNPEVRGPLTFETDGWGFACVIIEMFTGVRPWHNLSPREIFSRVVLKKERPKIPNDLPPAIRNTLKSCFEYDSRNRPSFDEIIRAFESPDLMFKEGDWVRVRNRPNDKFAVVKTVMGSDSVVLKYFDHKKELVDCDDDINKMSLWKHGLKIGDLVKLKESAATRVLSESETIRTEGTIIGIDKIGGTVLVKFSESQAPVDVNPTCIERVSSGLVVEDLVRVIDGCDDSSTASQRAPCSVGLIHGIEANGNVKVAFLGREMLWSCDPKKLEKVKAFHEGQFVKIRSDVLSPRFQWPLRKDRCWDTGKVIRVAPNGGLVVSFPGRLWNWEEWWADPEEVKVVHLDDYDNLVDKYRHLEATHWIVRPLVFSLVSFIALKVSVGVIGTIPFIKRGKEKEKESGKIKMELITDHGKDANAGNSWLPPSVASILFREGTPIPN